ncbi:phasin family protein [Lysobacter sp. S4-A87]|uniref:phasin family protein n=1 Tax=Lysobacter sp. S4-A87 TaxID=2925843 RepID=UPI001F53815A|nr:phasin family protein [Lysobacter sp. S4-A87]UNK49676.1 phasin family protein [Lysobacter sp. S4-A87]
MAKFKKAAKKASTGRSKASKADAQKQAEQLSRSLSESAQQIWLAGVGAFSRAQAEGTKLFDALIKEGMTLEQTARKFAGGQADVVRDAVESKVGQARDRAADTWDRLEKVFEERVNRALIKLGVPGRDDLTELSRKVDALTAELRRQGGKPAAARKAPAAKKAAKKAPAARKPRKSAAT